MPTYKNNTSVTGWGEPITEFQAGETRQTNVYVRSLPPGTILISHQPVIRPWQLLAADGAGLIDVSQWKTIIVYTAADAVTISANTDDPNALPVPANTQQIFDNSHGLIGCLQVLTGTASVWGAN